MQRGFYGFEHSYLSRAGNKQRGKSGPLHLSAVASYMSNVRKVGNVIAVNLPTDRGRLYSELNRHTNSVTRKNGRIAETFLISFDVRMTPEHQDEALGRFLMAVTFQGKTRAEGWRHVDHDHNPHAHVLLIDVDENGEQVAHFGRSGSWRRENSPVKGNPTVWLRQTWEDECNAVLEAYEYGFRIDRRTKVEQTIARQQAERLAGLPEEDPSDRPFSIKTESTRDTTGFENQGETQEPASECTPMPIDDPGKDDTEEDLSEPEETMATSEKLTPKQAAIVASEFYDELRGLRHLKAKLEGLAKAIEGSEAKLRTAEAESSAAALAKSAAEKQKHAAEQALKSFQSDRGLKGFSIPLGFGKWKLEWKSALRKDGEKALASFESLSAAFENAEIQERNAALQVERWQNDRKAQEEKRDATQHQVDLLLSQYGEHETLENAERTLNHAAHSYLDGVTVEDLLDLYETSQISTSQYRDALELMGETQRLEELDALLLENLDERTEMGLNS